MYEAFLKRQVIKGMTRRKDAMIAALWANDGLNDDKGTRTNAISEIEENFQAAIEDFLNPGVHEEEYDPDNPFFSAMKRGQAKWMDRISETDTKTVQAVMEQEKDFEKYIDQ